MSDKVRLLVSGPGLIGKKHVDLIEHRSDAELAAIVAPATDINRDYAQAHGVPLFDSVEEALAATSIGAAIISSPNAFHHDQVVICVDQGLPVLVEKPLTDDLGTARHLADMSDQTGVPVLVGHHRTYSPLLETAKDFVSSDAFGTPVAVQGSALFYKPESYFQAGPWRTRKGGGPLLINMIHEIGIMRYLYGEIESVSAHVSSATRGFEVEDSAAIALHFENGALGTFLLSDACASSKSWEMTAGENPAYPFFPDEDSYHFSGTMGSLDFPSMRFRSYHQREERSWWAEFGGGRLTTRRHDPLDTQLAHFLDVIRGQAQPRVSARDGYRNMVVLEAINMAAVQGRKVDVKEIH